MTELCDLARKYGTDKAIYYTPFYHELLKDRRNALKVMELGIGYPETMLSSVCRMGLTEYRTGASLFMWEEYFPEAQIFALDNKPEIFINQGRIKSFFVDQMDPKTFDDLLPELGYGFDLIVEDGWHTKECQVRSALKLLPLVKEGGIYIAEDIGDWAGEIMEILDPFYFCELKDFGEARVIVVRP